MTTGGPIRTETLHGGAVERVWLARPRANILDAEMVAALGSHVRGLALRLRSQSALKAVVFSSDGEHFSFGASVAEHLPASVGLMLRNFHAFFLDLERLGVPTVAVVRGRCLGGGAELAMMCGRVFCDRTAVFAVPEIHLGVFPPIAAVTWPWRVGGAKAADLILTGRNVRADEAIRIGLVDEVADDPEAALQDWLDTHVLPRSAVALRHAWKAVRAPLTRDLGHHLLEIERLYLEQLTRHSDPVEGIQAFLEKRAPVWTDA